ncbi:MAG: hypothetical protein ACOYU4_00240 [Thermodesulfobacteriota bacterium]
MEPRGICRFCDIVLGLHQYSGIDEPFASNDEFFAIASIGALVEGWTLIIPKSHQLSMRDKYNSPLFGDFLGPVLSALIHRYGPLIAFEHGANTEGSITACGTAHAHLHLVPFGGSLFRELQNSEMKWIECHASEIASKSGEHEYLFYTELGTKELWQDPVGYLHVLKNPVSQYFRRLIARRIGQSKVSDYKRFPHLDTARQTRSVLASSFA